MSEDKQYPPQQQQQPQGPQTIKCDGCGGSSLFERSMADPTSGKSHQVHRCRDCGQIRWSDEK